MNLVDTFSEFKTNKNIDRPTMVRVLEDVFRTLIRKKFGSDENFDVIVNTTKGDLELWRVREIVSDGEVTDDRSQISISEALSIDEDYEIGEECYEQLYLEDFGRRAIMAARQTLISRIMELEKDEIYKKYTERVGDIVLGEVHQILKREVLVLDDVTNNELVLPRSEMIKGDFFRKGDMVKGVIKRVEMKNNTPVVILSRTDSTFLEKLLEQEVPEIEDGLITVRRIVRIPGDRAKVAVESYDDRIDPVGACVGMKGSRIHGIVRELRNENIDIINYTNNLNLFIQRALTPARVTKIDLDTEAKRAAVYLESDQVSLAIGKGGTNIKLASKLTEFEIDVYRNQVEHEDDVDLDEFRDEIEDWVIDALKTIGCDTAKSVLNLSTRELVRRTDLEEETVEEVLKILEAEFEEDNQSKGKLAAKANAEKIAKAAKAAEAKETQPEVEAEAKTAEVEETQPEVEAEAKTAEVEEIQPEVEAEAKTAEAEETQPEVEAEAKTAEDEEIQPEVEAEETPVSDVTEEEE